MKYSHTECTLSVVAYSSCHESHSPLFHLKSDRMVTTSFLFPLVSQQFNFRYSCRLRLLSACLPTTGFGFRFVESTHGHCIVELIGPGIHNRSDWFNQSRPRYNRLEYQSISVRHDPSSMFDSIADQ